MSTPIADLSYRNYEGTLESPRMRWWVIARLTIMLALKKKGLWILTAFSASYYVTMVIILFFVDTVTQTSPGSRQGLETFMDRIVWKDQFLHGFSMSQLPLLLMALLIGAGSIANDNRANALLVYLSKPVSKLDYLFGKWFGVFLPLLIVMLIPTLVFYGYGAMTFGDYGFIRDDPWILPKMLMVLPLSAALHASMVVGISALFNQGRVAGATYAGIYLLLNFFTKLMQIVWFSSRGEAPAFVKTAFYASIDGIQIGLTKAILGTAGSPLFGLQPPNGRGAPPIDAPPLLACLAAILGITALCLGLAWRRIRAVEVVS